MTRPTWGVVILSGSSGRDESARAQALRSWGLAAEPFTWFGGLGQVPGICEVPLESFGPALDEMREHADHVAVLGTSKGAEAALLLGVHDRRVDAVVALSPPAHVWTNVGPGRDGRERPARSSFSVEGSPLPFVRTSRTWEPPPGERPALRGLYEASLARCEEESAARIPVEAIEGPVVVSGGGDDQVWPSDVWAALIAQDRRAAGRSTEVVVDPEAGHQVRLPGERPRTVGTLASGGTVEADARVGVGVRDAILRSLVAPPTSSW